MDMEATANRPEEVTEMKTEVIKNVKARNLKTGDRLHNTHGPDEYVLDVQYLDGRGCADTVKVYTTATGPNAKRSQAICATDSYPADHMVATIIEEG